jgi:nucleotide-binding universal stress UspA family protein
MAAGFATQQGLIKKYGRKGFQQQWAPRFPALSTVGVVGIVFIAMALKAKAIAGSPQMLIYILVPLALIYTFNYLLSTVTGKYLLPRGNAIALVYGSVMRNLSIALAIAINAFGPQGSSAALVIAVAYIIQVQSAAWYVRLTDKIYGAPSTAEKPSLATPPEPATAAAQYLSDTGPMVPTIRKILYATDLSETARYAVRYACGIAYRQQAEVTMLHVVPDSLEALSVDAGFNLSANVDTTGRDAFNEAAVQKAKAAIDQRIRETSEKVVQEIPACPLADEHIRVEVGDPADRIVSVAKEGQFDMVIMGTHGHGKLEEAMIGSVAVETIRKCPAPVMVVRLPA